MLYLHRLLFSVLDPFPLLPTPCALHPCLAAEPQQRSPHVALCAGKTIQAISLIVTHREDRLPALSEDGEGEEKVASPQPQQGPSPGAAALAAMRKGAGRNKGEGDAEPAKPLRIALPHVLAEKEGAAQQQQQQQQQQTSARVGANAAANGIEGAATHGRAAEGTQGKEPSAGCPEGSSPGIVGRGSAQDGGCNGAAAPPAAANGKAGAGRGGGAASTARHADGNGAGPSPNAAGAISNGRGGPADATPRSGGKPAAAAAAMPAPARKQRRAAQDRDYFLSTWAGGNNREGANGNGSHTSECARFHLKQAKLCTLLLTPSTVI